MRAIGLRVVVGRWALVAGLAVAGASASWADEAALKAAFDDYAAGKYEDALVKLRDYAATNPGNAEVYAVLRIVDEKVKLKALTLGGEHERLMRYLMDKARPEVETRKRDPEKIQKLVEDALSTEIDVRRRARFELASVGGDYAVPFLLPHLASQDNEKAVNALFALHYIGTEAVLPLIEALDSSDARVRAFVAAALGDIGDARALPALRRAMQRDADENVRAKAAAAVARIRGGADMPAAEAYVRLGEQYLAGDPRVLGEVDEVYNLWRWESDALARYEIPAAMYGAQLAEEAASDALALQPDLLAARSLLVRSIVSQKLAGDLMGDKKPEALAGAHDLLTSQGFLAISAALTDSMARRDHDVAVEVCRLLAETYGRQDLRGHPLGAALGSPEKKVRYAAAVALLRMSPSTPFERSGDVPTLAAQAAAETALRQVLIIDDHPEARGRIALDLRTAGYLVADERDGWRGVMRAKGMPALDVVVIRSDLGEQSRTIVSQRWRSTLASVDELLADARTKEVRVVVVVAAESAEKLEAVKKLFTDKYGAEKVSFVEEPLVTTAYLPTIEGAATKGDLGKDRERALLTAADAAAALAGTNAVCAAWRFDHVAEPLSRAATDGATPEIRMNAVKALGNLRAGGAEALAKIVSSEDPEELRVEAAKSLGAVLAKVPGQPAEIDALIEAAKKGGAVGSAAMKALGQVQGLSPEQARAVFGDHRLSVGKKAE